MLPAVSHANGRGSPAAPAAKAAASVRRAASIILFAGLAFDAAASCLAPRPSLDETGLGAEGGGSDSDTRTESSGPGDGGDASNDLGDHELSDAVATEGGGETGGESGTGLDARSEGGSDAPGGNVDAPSGADRAGPPEAGTDAAPYVDPGIFCRSSFCDPRYFACCVDVVATGNVTCITPAMAAGSCGAGNPTPYTCDDTLDCEAAGHAGDICCADVFAGYVYGASCAPIGNCGDAGSQAVVCDPQAPTPCPSGARCVGVDGGSWATGLALSVCTF